MDLKIDAAGDLVLDGDDLALVTGLDAIAQHLRIRFQFFRGEWFLDTRVGVPWFEDILKKSPDLDVVNGLLREVITSTPGVTAITAFSLEIDRATRAMTVAFQAATELGPLDFSQTFIIPAASA